MADFKKTVVLESMYGFQQEFLLEVAERVLQMSQMERQKGSVVHSWRLLENQGYEFSNNCLRKLQEPSKKTKKLPDSE